MSMEIVVFGLILSIGLTAVAIAYLFLRNFMRFVKEESRQRIDFFTEMFDKIESISRVKVEVIKDNTAVFRTQHELILRAMEITEDNNRILKDIAIKLDVLGSREDRS